MVFGKNGGRDSGGSPEVDFGEGCGSVSVDADKTRACREMHGLEAVTAASVRG
jgi:hypothetical protein